MIFTVFNSPRYELLRVFLFFFFPPHRNLPDITNRCWQSNAPIFSLICPTVPAQNWSRDSRAHSFPSREHATLTGDELTQGDTDDTRSNTRATKMPTISVALDMRENSRDRELVAQLFNPRNQRRRCQTNEREIAAN